MTSPTPNDMAGAMTLEQITAIASQTIADGDSVAAMTLARWILENIGESAPCGFDPPIVDASDGTPQVVIPDEWGGFWSPQDARACAAMLMRAADQAEAIPDEAEQP